MTDPRTAAGVPPGRLVNTIGLHFVPGVLTMVVYLLIVPFLMGRGFPALFALLLATALVLIPFELGYLLYRSHHANGRLTLRGVVGLREDLPRSQYVIWPVILFGWGFLSSALASPFDGLIRRELFSWLPSWFFAPSLVELQAYSPAVLWTMFVLGMAVVGFAGPIAEELYFRGHLLPRLGRFGRWAPLLHATLFSLYHFWTPWQNPSRILLAAAMSYVVWRKRNLYLAMIAHCALNAVVWAVTFGAILRGR